MTNYSFVIMDQWWAVLIGDPHNSSWSTHHNTWYVFSVLLKASKSCIKWTLLFYH